MAGVGEAGEEEEEARGGGETESRGGSAEEHGAARAGRTMRNTAEEVVEQEDVENTRLI